MVLIISYPILRVKFAPFVETMRFEGAQLNTQRGESPSAYYIVLRHCH